MLHSCWCILFCLIVGLGCLNLKINLVEILSKIYSPKNLSVFSFVSTPKPRSGLAQTLAQLSPPALGPWPWAIGGPTPLPRTLPLPQRARGLVARPARPQSARVHSPPSPLSLRSRAHLSTLFHSLPLSLRYGARSSASPPFFLTEPGATRMAFNAITPPCLQALIEWRPSIGHQTALMPGLITRVLAPSAPLLTL